MSQDTADPERALANAVAARRWGAGAAFEVRRIGEGANNTIWRAGGPGEDVAIKLSRAHREAGALGEYRKEAWCAARAREASLQTPAARDFGTIEGRAFAILDFIYGTAPAPGAAVWCELGAMARKIHGVATQGWGFTLSPDGRFEENWQAHLDYNIASLTSGDELIARGVFDWAGAKRLRGELDRLARAPLRFGLCHGDIALWNVLIDRDGTSWLLDWGCAAAHVVPHYEINEILRTARPAAEQFEAFLAGYGLSQDAYAAMARDLRALSALREVDTLRWAIEKSPSDIATQIARARAAVAKLT